MLTRRSMMLASIAAGVAMNSRTASAKAAQPATPVNFDIPAGACDCHTHIHPDPAKFPFFAGRVYTPELASPEEMTALHKALKMERVVIVTPSIYGPDNSATLFGMAARGPTARGVAVIDDKTSEGDLDAMGKAGIRGIRLNLATGGVNDPNVGRPRFTTAVERMKARGWHVQIYHQPADDHRGQGSGDGLAGAGRVRPFRRRTSGARRRAARLCRPRRSRQGGQGLCEDLRRLPRLEARARLRRLRAVRPGADRGQPRPHRLGHRLAASGFRDAGRQANRPT